MKKITTILLIVSVIILALIIVATGLIILRGNEDTWICVNDQWVKHGNPRSPQPLHDESCPGITACTMEAKICPDGSSVGRTGANCEFAECPATSTTQMANPASVYCKDNGGKLEIRNEENGQVGYCKFNDGSQCEEWAFMRGECQKGGKQNSTSTQNNR
ncbi:MAG: DUF333 domain-containing protein [Patescibacteria group bacterium]|jgi:putative hemolysin